MLTELLNLDAIILQYTARDAEDVIRLLSKKLQEGGFVHDTFADAALNREAELPTGLMLGGAINAAIPHTNVEHVIHPALAMATLSQPVTFQHMIDPTEAVPVQLVFLLALEQPKSQIAMLQEVAGILQDAELIDQLMAATTVEQTMALLSNTNNTD